MAVARNSSSRLTDARGRQLARGKDSGREQQLFRHRALLALALVAALLTLLGARLAQLQLARHAYFSTQSENNRVRLEPLPPTRGLIFDRNGTLLAENLPSHRLEVTPELVDDLDRTLTELGERVIIEEDDLARFRRLQRGRKPYSGVPLRFDLDQGELARLAVELHRYPGVSIRADLTRHYPLGSLTAHVVGYVGRIDENDLKRIDAGQYAGTNHIGKTGVERAREDRLHGRVGHQRVEINAQGRVLRVLDSTPPEPGRNLYLGLDVDLQRAARLALGDYSGAAVALDPRNGEVLALVSVPDYPPNPFVNGIDFATYRTLNTSPERPLFNRAIMGVYPPGSTIKPMMALVGLAAGVVDRHSTVYCPGYFELPGRSRRFRDWRRGGHGRVAMTESIAESCDVYYYELALELGIDRMHALLGQFGFGAPTGIDLVGERSGLLPSTEWKQRVHDQPWYAGETVIAGIGQGYMLVTPLQLAHATATVAMQGQRIRPRLLHAAQIPGTGVAVTEPAQTLPAV
ncbi:MAG: penicillin-binding protein 2, partial [Candidatus Competibacterales bacterium]|nr:penicillin-binding protein 2 [Candidatus Competibacterales bacterium]